MDTFTRWGALVLLSSVLLGCAGDRMRAGSPASEPLYQQLTDSDIALADSAVQYALDKTRSREETQWQNPASGNGGTVTPLTTVRSANGYYCRTYAELVRVGRQFERYEEMACRRDDGIWYAI